MKNSTKPEASFETADHSEQQPISVLCVDDEEEFVKNTKQILEMQGNFLVEYVTSVEDAQQKMSIKEFDALVCDYQMPIKDGLDFLKELRESKNYIPFILFTGKSRTEVAIKALNLGADRYFYKFGPPETVYGELAHGIRQAVAQRKAEEALRRSEEKYRTIVELSPDGIVSVNELGIITSVNNAILERTGFSKTDFLGKHFTQITALQKEPPPNFQKVIQAFLAEKFPPKFEFNYTCKDGSQRSGDARIGLLKQKDKLVGLQVIFRDITESKQTIAKIKRQRKIIDYMTEKMGVRIATITKEFQVDWRNTSQELENNAEQKHCYEIFHNRKQICPKCGVKEVFETGKGLVVHQQKLPGPDGQCRWLETYSTPIKENGKTILALELAVDITKRKNMVNSLQESETKLRTLLDTAHVIVQSVDEKGNFVYVNKYWKNSLGYTDEDLKNITLMDIIRKDYHNHCMDLFKKVITGELVDDIDSIFLTKNGKEIWVKGTAKPIYRDGKFHSTVGVFLDITESKKTEKNLQKTLINLERLNEKLDMIGKLTRHDARNKLSSILNHIYIAKKRLNENLDPTDCLETIESISTQIEEIFEFARICEKVGTEHIKYTNVSKSVDEAIMLLFGSDDKKIVNQCEGLVVLADSLLRQMFYNLLDNSMRHGKNVTQIKIYYKELEEKLAIVYEDNGGGIPEGEKIKIFQEGYGKGTGYGLYLIKKTFESYGWNIEENGIRGKGAKFWITIPQTNESGQKCYMIN
ncbi:MAG: PAS domain S-box protein [Candidatus Bathyarchaeota archaeon]|nr:PAS domain S-box protein [Candidatus Bathyarchaeota archaeon]